MKENNIQQQIIFDIIENQVRDANPPETKQTLERLMQSGYSEEDAKKYIGQCVLVELSRLMKHQRPFDEKKYVQNLLNLPKEPFD
jgi:predicted nucleic-acid-binding protein